MAVTLLLFVGASFAFFLSGNIVLCALLNEFCLAIIKLFPIKRSSFILRDEKPFC